MNQPFDPPIDITKKASYQYAFNVTSADGKQEILHTHFIYDPTDSRAWLDKQFPKPAELSAQASFNPVRSMLQTSIDVIDFPHRADTALAKTVVTDAAGKVLGTPQTDKTLMSMYNDLLSLPPLAPESISWTASVVLKDNTEVKAGEGEFEKKDEAKEFPWWNFFGGNAEKVLWPYAKVSAEKGGSVVTCWGKEFRLDGLALPAHILVTGNADKWPGHWAIPKCWRRRSA